MKSINLTLLFITVFYFRLFSQGIDLQQAILLAQENSFEYQIAKNKLQAKIWQYEFFRSSFKPNIFLEGNVPNYTRAINRITLPNGEDTFVSQNQAFSSIFLGLRQPISLTGGDLTINSSINRIDVFGSKNIHNYSSTPISISYYQDNLAFNNYKWQKKIEPLELNAAQQQYIYDLEDIAIKTVNYFFYTLICKNKYEQTIQNLNSIDTLLRITTDRFNLGKISKSTILQLNLNRLNALKQKTSDSIDYLIAKQEFIRYIKLDKNEDLNINVNDKLFFFKISKTEALQYLNNLNVNLLKLKLSIINAEKEYAEIKSKNNIKFKLSANFGMTTSSNNFSGLISNLENQQQISLGFSIPIADWNLSKTQLLRAEENRKIKENENEFSKTTLEDELINNISKWDILELQIERSKLSRDISYENYNLELSRFIKGNITFNDLILAQQLREETSTSYINNIRLYWELYYNIRKLTLYNFRNNTKLNLNN